jgi:hypothetical protein
MDTAALVRMIPSTIAAPPILSRILEEQADVGDEKPTHPIAPSIISAGTLPIIVLFA